MDILVTGGAGFIGSNLVRALAESGDRVRILDDMSTGSTENIRDIPGLVDMTIGDVRDANVVGRALCGAEIVYHLCALPSVARSVADPASSHEVNVRGTLNVLMAARDEGVRRVVYASSSSVYGDTPTLPKDEGMSPAPLSPYAATKLAGEAYCRAFASVYGLETVSLRFFNVFGPRQDPMSEYAAVVPKFVSSMLAGRAPVIFGDGRQTRDFTFVANVVDACMLAASAGTEAVGEAINVGCGGRLSLLELVSMLNGVLRTSVEPLFAPPRDGDVRDSEASIDKARRLLGYQPIVAARDGLAEAVRWFASRQSVEVMTS
ncbi:MAG: SDR family oxidoreductase [Actinomycetota bacterium]